MKKRHDNVYAFILVSALFIIIVGYHYLPTKPEVDREPCPYDIYKKNLNQVTGPDRVAILFKTHTWSRYLERLAARISKAAHIDTMPHDFIVMCDVTKGRIRSKDGSRIRHQSWNFTETMVRDRFPDFLNTWNQEDPPMILFSDAHPEYKYIWSIEYDVVYTGSWFLFLEDLEAKAFPMDLLTVVPIIPATPDWAWYTCLDQKKDVIPERHFQRGFFAFSCFSRDFMQTLAQYYDKGWMSCGWEANVGTIAHASNAVVKTITPPCIDMTWLPSLRDPNKTLDKLNRNFEDCLVHPVKMPDKNELIP